MFGSGVKIGMTVIFIKNVKNKALYKIHATISGVLTACGAAVAVSTTRGAAVQRFDTPTRQRFDTTSILAFDWLCFLLQFRWFGFQQSREQKAPPQPAPKGREEIKLSIMEWRSDAGGWDDD